MNIAAEAQLFQLHFAASKALRRAAHGVIFRLVVTQHEVRVHA